MRRATVERKPGPANLGETPRTDAPPVNFARRRRTLLTKPVGATTAPRTPVPVPQRVSPPLPLDTPSSVDPVEPPRPEQLEPLEAADEPGYDASLLERARATLPDVDAGTPVTLAGSARPASSPAAGLEDDWFAGDQGDTLEPASERDDDRAAALPYWMLAPVLLAAVVLAAVLIGRPWGGSADATEAATNFEPIVTGSEARNVPVIETNEAEPVTEEDEAAEAEDLAVEEPVEPALVAEPAGTADATPAAAAPATTPARSRSVLLSRRGAVAPAAEPTDDEEPITVWQDLEVDLPPEPSGPTNLWGDLEGSK